MTVKTSKSKPKKIAKDRKKKDNHKTELVMAKSDDLREVVTETVTKLLAEDVLEMDEDGIIDIKDSKKPKRTKKQDDD